ncbi:metal-dependent hydrolase [Burkholderia ubonensis]|uniref:metal-dependent hydrolase n=1 Tax=Burkholderia ubonensis TaxID=101571 RepID=UPI0009B4CB59|nr:metal-dependent hydrolase [Burkholderia ubonensis]
MTGRGHRWTGLGAAFMAAAAARLSGMNEVAEIAAALVAASSTTMPDWIEIPFYKNGIRSGSLIAHRTLTHWPPLWLLLIAWGVRDGSIVGALAIGAAIGSIFHILGDAPNPMGIPWLLPHRRIRFGQKGWWRSGQHEILMTLSFTAFGFAAWYLAGGPAAYGLTKYII